MTYQLIPDIQDHLMSRAARNGAVSRTIKDCSGSGLIQSTKWEKETKSHFHTNLKIKLIKYLPEF